MIQFPYNDFTKGISIKGEYHWPNEISSFRDQNNQIVILIPDGFLMPGQDDGALYAVRNPNKKKAVPIRITTKKPGWFYHRAVFVELSNGKKGILTARAHKPLFGQGRGELVWLSFPESDERTWWETSEAWPETVLVEGPDVMFEILHRDDDVRTLTICCAHFFGKKLSVHLLRESSVFPFIEVVESEYVDTIGSPYGLCLTTMPARSPVESVSTSRMRRYGNTRRERLSKVSVDYASTAAIINGNTAPAMEPTHLIVSTHECSYDIPKALQMVWAVITGKYPRINTGESVFKVGEKSIVEKPKSEEGGALIAYEIPSHTYTKKSLNISQWNRHTLFRGFKVRGWGGIFSPGTSQL